jgi:hypothetical protein
MVPARFWSTTRIVVDGVMVPWSVTVPFRQLTTWRPDPDGRPCRAHMAPTV